MPESLDEIGHLEVDVEALRKELFIASTALPIAKLPVSRFLSGQKRYHIS
jgi:hypothetical protein